MGQESDPLSLPSSLTGAKAEPLNGEPQLEQQIQEKLGRSLQAYYSAIVNETIPARFLVLLAELESKEKKKAGPADGNGES